MIILFAAALAGGVTGAALSWGHGVFAALLCAPVGASLSTLAAAVITGYRPVEWAQRKLGDSARDAGVVTDLKVKRPR